MLLAKIRIGIENKLRITAACVTFWSEMSHGHVRFWRIVEKLKRRKHVEPWVRLQRLFLETAFCWGMMMMMCPCGIFRRTWIQDEAFRLPFGCVLCACVRTKRFFINKWIYLPNFKCRTSIFGVERKQHLRTSSKYQGKINLFLSFHKCYQIFQKDLM